MAPVYTVAHLPAEKVDQAFPLMRAIDSQIELAEWRAMCAAMRARGDAGTRTVLVASGPTGHYRALCIVGVQQSPPAEPAVAVSKLFIDSAVDTARVARAVVEALAACCASHGCSRLQIESRGTDDATIAEVAAASSSLRGSSIAVELV